MSDLEKILHIMAMSPRYRDFSSRYIVTYVIPPLRLGQYRIYHDEEVPFCYASWAMLSDELSEKYGENKYRIKNSDWNSGNNLWLVNMLCPNGKGSIALRRLDKLRKELGLPKKVNFKRLGSNRVGNVERI